jgi:hypothetical protein
VGDRPYQWRWIVRWTVGAVLPMVLGWLFAQAASARRWGSDIEMRWDAVWWVLSVLAFSVVVKGMVELAWFAEWRTTTRGKYFVIGGFLEGLVWWFAAAGLLGSPPRARAPHELMRWGLLQTLDYNAGDAWKYREMVLHMVWHSLWIDSAPFTSTRDLGFTGNGQAIWVRHFNDATSLYLLDGSTPQTSASGHLWHFLKGKYVWRIATDDLGFGVFAAARRDPPTSEPSNKRDKNTRYFIELSRLADDPFWISPALEHELYAGSRVAVRFTPHHVWTVAWVDGPRLSIQTPHDTTHHTLHPKHTAPIDSPESERRIRPVSSGTPVMISEDARWVAAHTNTDTLPHDEAMTHADMVWDIIDLHTKRTLHLESKVVFCPIHPLGKKMFIGDMRWRQAWDLQNGLLVLSDEGALRVVDVRTGDVVESRLVRPAGTCVWGLKLNANADRIALLEGVVDTESPEGYALPQHQDTVTILNLATGEEVVSLAHENVVWLLAFDPAGRKLATAESDGMMHLWAIP